MPVSHNYETEYRSSNLVCKVLPNWSLSMADSNPEPQIFNALFHRIVNVTLTASLFAWNINLKRNQ